METQTLKNPQYLCVKKDGTCYVLDDLTISNYYDAGNKYYEIGREVRPKLVMEPVNVTRSFYDSANKE